jgi:exosortase
LFLTPYPVWPAMLVLCTAAIVAAAVSGARLLGGAMAARWLAGPFVLLLPTFPVPTLAEKSVVQPLREAIAQVAAEISNLAGRPAIASGTSVRLANTWVGIDEACGGIRSLQACLMIALFFGEWYRFSWGRRLALVAVGLGAAIGGNAVRVIFLSLRASAGVEALAAAHDYAGWIAMLASLALTGWMAWRWGGRRLPAARAAGPGERRVAPAAWAWVALVAAGFLFTETGVRLWYARGASRRAEIARWQPRFPSSSPDYRAEPLAEPAREMLRPDEFVAGSWPMPGGGRAGAYYVGWRGGQVARTAPFFHNPTVCMPMAGCELQARLPDFEVRWEGGVIPFFAYRFRRAGETLAVAFTVWDPAAGRPLASTHAPTWRSWMARQWEDVREARENQPAQLLAVSLPWSEDAGEQMRETLARLIEPAGGL